MSGKSKHAAYSEFRQLVEACPQGRLRIRPRYVPEITGILMLIDERVSKIEEGARAAGNRTPVDGIEETLVWASVCHRAIAWIGSVLNDKFDRHDWDRVSETLAVLFKIKPGAVPPGRSAEEDLTVIQPEE